MIKHFTSLALLALVTLPSSSFAQDAETAAPEAAAAPVEAAEAAAAAEAAEAAEAAAAAAAPAEVTQTSVPAEAAAPAAESSLADLFATPEAPAAAATAAAPGAENVSGFVLKLQGEHEFAYHQPTRGNPLSYEGEMKAPGFRNVLGLEGRTGALKLVSDWRLDLLLSEAGTGASVATGFDNGARGSWAGAARVRALDNYVRWSPESVPLKLTAGYQTFAWGAADMINPTDNLNPRDYSLGMMADNAKIPLLAADLVWYPTDALSVEAVYSPFDRPYRWPVDHASAVQAATGTSQPVTYEDLQFGPESSVAGGRIAWRGAVDLSLSYLYDHDQYYVAAVDGQLFALFDRNAKIALQRSRLHRLGADAKGTLGSFGLWAEAAANLPEESTDTVTQRHWWIDYVAGVDSNFGPADKAYFNLQYIGTVVPDYDNSPLDMQRVFTEATYGEDFYRRALAGSLGFQTAKLWQGGSLDLKVDLFDGQVKPELRVIYLVPVGYDDSTVTQYGSLAINPELDISPLDSFHILVGADLAYSWYKPKDGEMELNQTTDRLGEFTRFNNVYVKLAYKWGLEAK